MPRNPWDHAVQFRDTVDPPRSSRRERFSRRPTASRSRTACPSGSGSSSSGPTCTRSPSTASRSQHAEGSGGSTRRSAGSTSPRWPRSGENAVTIKASPFTVFHEIEAAYLLGDFSLKAVDEGFVIVPPQAAEAGPLERAGHARCTPRRRLLRDVRRGEAVGPVLRPACPAGTAAWPR